MEFLGVVEPLCRKIHVPKKFLVNINFWKTVDRRKSNAKFVMQFDAIRYSSGQRVNCVGLLVHFEGPCLKIQGLYRSIYL